MFKYKRIILKLLIITSVISSFPIYFVFANPLDSWQSPKAYKPKPILFLHGFAKGRPLDWNGTKAALTVYFSKYQPLGSYLETIDFQDSNGSVDRYPSGKFNPQGNSAGWAEKVKNKVDELLSSAKYGFYTNKLNLVCHSMGGLAARWYLANYSSNFVDKLILIGVPNFGSRWAELANAASKVPKVGWLNVLTTNGLMSIARQDLNFALWFFREIDVYGEAVDDMDPSPATGSGFLNNLNSLPQPQSISYYGIIGIVGSFMNRYIANGDYYGGDCIVSKTSQLGTGNVSYKEWSQINANHWQEIKAAGEGTFSSILYFLDSTTPELEITYPGPGTTEIYESSIHIQGGIFKEYLPADSILHLKVVRESDGTLVLDEDRPDSIKPSSLWIPNNPDSPVAEFDEVITFPGKGTYKISCQIKNPAGITSDIKETWVNVIVSEGTNIIVHCHNPEGKEIASIQGVGQNSVEIYDGDTRIGYGASNAETHNKPIAISSGTHTIKAKFNGMTQEQAVPLNPNETKMIAFTFKRIDWDFRSYLNSLGTKFSSNTESHTAQPKNHIINRDIKVDPNARTPPCIDQVVGCNLYNYYSIYPATWVITAWAKMIINSSGIISSVGFNYECLSLDKTGNWLRMNGVGQGGNVPAFLDYCNDLKSVPFEFWFVQRKPSAAPTGKRAIMVLITPYCFLEDSDIYKIHKVQKGDNGVELFIVNERPSCEASESGKGSAQSEALSASFYFDNCFVSSVPYDLLGTGV